MPTFNRKSKHVNMLGRNEIDTAHQRLVQDGNDNDIAGTWYFEMPELTENYQSGDITWEIARPDSSGFRWASFDLLILGRSCADQLGRQVEREGKAIHVERNRDW